MRSLKDLMAEMGFNKSASIESQKAFIKHLIFAANTVATPQVESNMPKSTTTGGETAAAQLEFDLSDSKRVS